MINIDQQIRTESNNLTHLRNYQEIIAYLDQHWLQVPLDYSKARMLQIDALLNYPSREFNAILVAGTNGKSLTAHFITKLCQAANLTVGCLTTPHILNYEERFSINQNNISQKQFTELANQVINILETAQISANSLEILTALGLLYFKAQKVNLAVLEVRENRAWDPVTICNTKILAITRITTNATTGANLSSLQDPKLQAELQAEIVAIAEIAPKNCAAISADQSKINLSLLQTHIQAQGANWIMPVRKLVPLPYPFEQLHGRCAALAERVAQSYIDQYLLDPVLKNSLQLLNKPKGLRGRPKLETKRLAELDTEPTLELFWKSCVNNLPGKFQLLKQEKPTILLDSASNLDALENLLLGIRLLHYSNNLNGLVIIIGCENSDFEVEPLLRVLRYFFKKTAGQIIFCQVPKILGAQKTSYQTIKPWEPEKLTLVARNAKLKVRSAKTLAEALEWAEKAVDARHGLVVITGSQNIINDYWKIKEIKKLT